MTRKKTSQKKRAAGSPLRIIPFGGLDGIGKNMTLFEYEDSIIIVDCGIMFPSQEMPGIDFLIPDFSYLLKNRTKVKGLFITHGHEDHIGAVPYLLQKLPMPVYGTRLTLGLIRSRLEERLPKAKIELNEVDPASTVNLGPFTLEFMRVNHSIVDGIALAIKTPLGTIIHTGDFKIDYSPVDNKVADIYRFAEYGEKGVLLLLSDSTNALVPGYTGSENALNQTLIDLFASAKNRIFVATFASNINRIQQVLNAAQRYNRKVVVTGRSMLKNIEISRSLGYLNFKDGLIVPIEEANVLQDKKLVIICTGTQGEPMSALTRIANGTHKHFACKAGDTVIITASVIPGNERTVSSVVNLLLRMGAILYSEQDTDVHVSGHGSQEELKLMLSIVKPKFFMPIHGEFRMLQGHARLAEEVNIRAQNIMLAQNGDILELTNDAFRKTGQLELDTMFLDGTLIGDLTSSIINDRQTMAADGLVLITIVLAEGMLAHPPVIFTRGFAGTEENSRIQDMIESSTMNQLDHLLRGQSSKADIAGQLKRQIANLIFRNSRRNPLVEIQIMDV